jgi:hypothetical protein
MFAGQIKCYMLNVNMLQKTYNDNIIKDPFLKMLNECRGNIYSYLYKEALRGVMCGWRTSWIFIFLNFT